MVGALRRLGLVAALGSAILGCSHTTAQRKPPPPDPLLVTRKPIEGRPRQADADLTARLPPPAPPATAGDLGVAPSLEAPPPVQPVGLRSKE
jgi:hypothetical protein